MRKGSAVCASVCRMRGRSRDGALLRLAYAAAVFAGLLLSVFVFAAHPAAAWADEDSSGVASSAEEVVTLAPGAANYNASYATRDTVVLINQPGSYSLEGSSDRVRVVIEAGPGDEVRLYLENGLALSPKKGAAILVSPTYDDTDQPHVSLILSRGAKVSLSGGDHSPAVSMEGSPGIATAPPSSNPLLTVSALDAEGTLELSGSASGSATPAVWNTGLGGVEFARGTVAATGGQGNAAITSLGEVVVSGGALTAVGGAGAPAIGSVDGRVSVLVTGGAVYTTGGSGAPGIGSVNSPASISVEGGVVEAAGGAGAPAIGSVEGSADVSISGGIVSLENASLDKAPLVGSVNGDAVISVSGGITLGSGEYGQLALGSKAGSAQISFSGGTVEVGLAACGSGKDGKAQVIVSGGSFTGVTMGTGASAFTAINRAGVTVYRVFVGLEDAPAGIPVSLLEVNGSSPAYATNGLVTSKVQVREGVTAAGVMVWLPDTGEVVSAADGEGNLYRGEIHPTKPTSGLDYGLLELACNLTLDPNTDFGYEGEARVRHGSREVVVEETVEPNEEGLTLLGFFDKPVGGVMVLDAEYRLVAGAEGWVDAQGVWERTDAPFVLYAQWEVDPDAGLVPDPEPEPDPGSDPDTGSAGQVSDTGTKGSGAGAPAQALALTGDAAAPLVFALAALAGVSFAAVVLIAVVRRRRVRRMRR